MYICDYCGKDCNRLTNVFITLNLCPSCLNKWYKGELGNEKEKEKEEEEEKKEEVKDE